MTDKAGPVHPRAIDHIELRTRDVYATTKMLCEQFGFDEIAYADHTTGRKRTESSVVRQGDITFIVSSPLSAGYLTDVIKRHGDGAHDVAFLVDNVEEAHQRALALGALEAAAVRHSPEGFADSAIWACGPVVHSLIERTGYDGPFAPGFRPVRHPRFSSFSAGLTSIDHVVLNVRLGDMEHQADFYERVFGFSEFARFTPDQISTPKAALRSVVMRSANGVVTIPINEPVADKPGHIGEFLRDRSGPGVQHIALRTNNIFLSAQALASRGVRFCDPPPDTYYEDVLKRVKSWNPEDLAGVIDRARPLGILIDQDSKGILFQIFTKVVLGRGEGLFFELIQRLGSEGFGAGNFKALFESIERAAGRL